MTIQCKIKDVSKLKKKLGAIVCHEINIDILNTMFEITFYGLGIGSIMTHFTQKKATCIKELILFKSVV